MNLVGILGFALKNWKYLLFSALAFAAGMAIAWKAQDIKVSRLHSQLDTLKAELKACNEAMQSNLRTIENLKNEIKKTSALCKKRIQTKEAIIRNIQKIDELETKNEKDSADDALLDALNRMFR